MRHSWREMEFCLALLALTALRFAGAQEILSYEPYLTPKDLAGKVTASTFTLQQPRCVFKDIDPNDEIWLVVSLSDETKNFDDLKPPAFLPYQAFGNNSYYMTLNTVAANYPCPEDSKELSVLRVGTETKCINDASRPDCNGPLPGPGPYRVKFVAYNSTGPILESSWSKPITLIQAKDPETIDTWPGRRSAATIIIATILSILAAVLIAALITALLYKYSNICGSADIGSVRDPGTVTRYTTHHVYDQPALKS